METAIAMYFLNKKQLALVRQLCILMLVVVSRPSPSLPSNSLPISFQAVYLETGAHTIYTAALIISIL